MFWCSIWNASNTFWWEVGGNNRSKYCESVQMFLSFQFCANLIFLWEYFPVISHFRKTVSFKTRFMQTPNHFEMERSERKGMKSLKTGEVQCEMWWHCASLSEESSLAHIWKEKVVKLVVGGAMAEECDIKKEKKIRYYFISGHNLNIISSPNPFNKLGLPWWTLDRSR